MSEAKIDPALERAGKTMRSLLRNATALRDAGDAAAAVSVYDRIARETPEALRDERWYDIALGLSSEFRSLIDAHPRRRIYIAGCGRSGTWFALGVFATYEGACITPLERHFGHFGRIAPRSEPVHVVKRNHDAFRYIADIPNEIAIVYLIRDPRDVMTSGHLDKQNYISLARWSAEMNAFRELLATNRPNLTVVRFEDLAVGARRVQTELADILGLDIRIPADRFTEAFQPDERTQAIMQQLRPPDASAVGRWRRVPDQIDLVTRLLPDIVRQFQDLGERFGYDLSG